MAEAPAGPDSVSRDGAGPQSPDPAAASGGGEHQGLAEHVAHLERRVGEVTAAVARAEAAATAARGTPAWKRVTDGETRVQVALAILVMIVLQLRLPARFSFLGWWLLPSIELVLLVTLLVLDPGRISRTERHIRTLSLGFVTVASLANGWAALSLILGIVRGTEGLDAESLLTTGANIWVTNVIVFGIWYWDLDRGGPAARAQALKTRPDFVFPQMTSPELGTKDWEPQFGDYLYLAFTNATAFSPTDVMPYSRWSKLTMALQATISVVIGALIIARAINILH